VDGQLAPFAVATRVSPRKPANHPPAAPSNYMQCGYSHPVRIRRRAASGVVVVPESIESLPANGEERAVIQILVNLIGNAIRYSPDGGRIRIDFSRTPGTASVSVSDEGPGIAASDQQRVFERFERAHPKEEGTGLGLAISRRLARSMGGDVTLDSTPGEGARFTLTLPAA